MQHTILIVDDEPDVVALLRDNFTMLGYLVFTATGCDDAVEKAAIANRLYIAFGMPVRRGGAVYNSLVVCGPQGLVGQYDKLHLAGAEPHWASQGEKLPLLFETPYGKIMCSLSYDSFCFPEMYRYACAKGASLVLNAAACAAPEMRAAYPVSYTHLDVYKRQVYKAAGARFHHYIDSSILGDCEHRLHQL